MTRSTFALVVVSFAAGASLGPRLVVPIQAQFRTAATTELSRLDLGTWCEGKEVVIETQEYGPGTSGRHFHPAHSFAYMLNGTQVKTVQGRPPVSVGVGEVLHEGPMEVHETTNRAQAKALVVRILDKGKPVTTRLP